MSPSEYAKYHAQAARSSSEHANGVKGTVTQQTLPDVMKDFKTLLEATLPG
jgi:hypothetical protein